MSTAAPEFTRAKGTITAEVSDPKCLGQVTHSGLTTWSAFVCVIPGTPPVLVTVEDITTAPPEPERFIRRYVLDACRHWNSLTPQKRASL